MSDRQIDVASKWLIGVGTLLVLAGLFFSGAASGSDTLNIGLLNDKVIYATVGGLFIVAGAVFQGSLAIVRAVSPASDDTTADD